MHASERDQRLILEGAAAAWAAHDLAAVKACVHRDAFYKHYLPPGAWPIPSSLRGKQNIVQSLSHFLHDFDVIRYRPLKIVSEGSGLWVSRITFQYAHKITGHSFEGTARIRTEMEDDKIRSFEIIHDAPRLHAFFEMVSRMGVEA
jgi:ketosteroid isomerase-like protein